MDILIRMLNSLLMFAIPLTLAAWVVRRLHLEWRIFLIGAGTFAGAQLFEIPFNRFLLQPFLERVGLLGANEGFSLLSLGLIFGLVAGLFEEGARYVVYRRWLRDVRSWEGGLFFGLGHGGMEAMMLGGLSFYVLLQTITFRNADLTTIMPPEQIPLAQAQLDAYWSAPWYAALLGALERAFAIGIQVGLAVIVMQTFIRRSYKWLVLAIGWHTVVDATAVFGASTWGIYLTEVFVGLMAALTLWFLYLLRPGAAGESAISPTPIPEINASLGRIGESVTDIPEERLEDSRYNSG